MKKIILGLISAFALVAFLAPTVHAEEEGAAGGDAAPAKKEKKAKKSKKAKKGAEAGDAAGAGGDAAKK